MKDDLLLSSPRTLLAIIAAMLVSVLLYAGLFGWVLHKPLSVGTVRDYFRVKVARAAMLPSPKLMFLGGSNVRFGLRCQLVEQSLGVPCVNAGFIADVGIDLLAQKFEPYLHRGDVVYIPLAYEEYQWTRELVATQSDAAYLFNYDRETLWQMSWYRQLHAVFHYNLPYMVSSAAEMALAAAGRQRKAGAHRAFGVDNLNAWGDEAGHTAEQGRDFANWIGPLPIVPDVDHFEPERYFYTQQLEIFLDWASHNGVTVIGGLPQTVDEITIPQAVIDRIREIFERHQQKFIDLPNHSQYSRDCFFDNLYHLNEQCQIEHTRKLLPLLAPYFPAANLHAVVAP